MTTVEERFWAKVDKTDGCWLWTGAKTKAGYGNVMWQGRNWVAHRVSYSLLVGPVPEGLDLDHTCHNGDQSCAGGLGCPHRCCVNPAHLEPVTRSVNLIRGKTLIAEQVAKTHCPQGHPYDAANTYVTKRGSRQCRICAKASNAQWYRDHRVGAG